MAKKILPKPQPKAPPKPLARPLRGEPDCQTCDAFAQSLDLTTGLDHLLWSTACDRNGLSDKGAYALASLADTLLDQMKVVDGYFHPADGQEKGGA